MFLCSFSTTSTHVRNFIPFHLWFSGWWKARGQVVGVISGEIQISSCTVVNYSWWTSVWISGGRRLLTRWNFWVLRCQCPLFIGDNITFWCVIRHHFQSRRGRVNFYSFWSKGLFPQDFVWNKTTTVRSRHASASAPTMADARWCRWSTFWASCQSMKPADARR